MAINGLDSWEEQLFHRLNGGPPRLEVLLWLPMQLGSLAGPVIVAGLSWVAWRRWRPSVGAVVAGVMAWWLTTVVKNAVDRGRPFETVQVFADRLGTPHDGLGFPSGHTAVAFSLAAVVSPYLTRTGRIAAYVLCVTVGLARIQNSAHLPLDVLGGAALGYTLGTLWNLAAGVPARPGETR